MADDKIAGVETSAVSLLKRAVELDSGQRYDEAMTCYQEGVALLMKVLKTVPTTEDAKRKRYRDKIEQYLARAEELKEFVKEEKEASKQHEQIQIEADSVGHSYDILFGRYLTDKVNAIEVEDPYIRSHHQIINFLRFCELVVAKKSPVKTICLTTGQDEDVGNQQQQIQKLYNIKKSLHNYGIELQVNYSKTLHDREIRLDTGWVIKIGRGLDIYKACDKFAIGFNDMQLRSCHATTVDIFHRKFVKSSIDSG